VTERSGRVVFVRLNLGGRVAHVDRKWIEGLGGGVQDFEPFVPLPSEIDEDAQIVGPGWLLSIIGQNAFQVLFGGLLAVKAGLLGLRRLSLPQDAGATKVAIGVGEPRAGSLALIRIGHDRSLR
jgi:hypothetical protein